MSAGRELLIFLEAKRHLVQYHCKRAGNANYSGQAGIWDIPEDGNREQNDQEASSAL